MNCCYLDSTNFHFHNKNVLNCLLQKACVELIVSDTIFDALRKRALDSATNIESTIQFFETLEKRRLEAKQNKKSHSTF